VKKEGFLCLTLYLYLKNKGGGIRRGIHHRLFYSALGDFVACEVVQTI
jgi:hypothetical protein